MTAALPPSQPVSASTGPAIVQQPAQDPTALTTQLVDRALLAYERLINARLDAMDLATKLQADNVSKIAASQENNRALLRDDVDRQLQALREYLLTEVSRVADVMREKFSGVDQQFKERDTRLGQADIERQKSLDAALAAQKEAVREQNTANDRAFGKSELSQKEQITALTTLTTTSIANLNDRITEIKERLDRAPGEAARETKIDRKADIGQILLAISVIIAAVSVVVAVVLSR